MRKMSELSLVTPCGGFGVSQEDWWSLGARAVGLGSGRTPPPFPCIGP